VLETVLILAAVTALGVVYRAAFQSDETIIRRTIAERPRTLARKIEGGAVRVTGKVEPRAELLRAPISGRPCVVYKLTLQDVRGRLVDSVSRAGTFAVVDETGSVLVEPEGELALALERDTRVDARLSALEGEPRVRVEAILREAGIPTEWGFWETPTDDLREEIMSDGAKVSVRGHAFREPRIDGEREGPRGVPETVVVRGGGEALWIAVESEAVGRWWG
jgi:hypothetical protein